MPDLICKNHRCGKQFTSAWKTQVYCCKKCVNTESNWRKAKGEKIVNAMLEGGCASDALDALTKVVAARGDMTNKENGQ